MRIQELRDLLVHPLDIAHQHEMIVGAIKNNTELLTNDVINVLKYKFLADNLESTTDKLCRQAAEYIVAQLPDLMPERSEYAFITNELGFVHVDAISANATLIERAEMTAEDVGYLDTFLLTAAPEVQDLFPSLVVEEVALEIQEENLVAAEEVQELGYDNENNAPVVEQERPEYQVILSNFMNYLTFADVLDLGSLVEYTTQFRQALEKFRNDQDAQASAGAFQELLMALPQDRQEMFFEASRLCNLRQMDEGREGHNNLINALEEGREENAIELVNQGAFKNYFDTSDWTVLSCATLNHNLAAASLLIDQTFSQYISNQHRFLVDLYHDNEASVQNWIDNDIFNYPGNQPFLAQAIACAQKYNRHEIASHLAIVEEIALPNQEEAEVYLGDVVEVFNDLNLSLAGETTEQTDTDYQGA